MTEVSTGYRLRGYLFALAATAIWSGNFIVARGLSAEVPPVTIAFYRWTIAMLVLLPFTVSGMWQQRKELVAHAPHLLITSFLGVTVFNTVIYIAGHKTTALNMSLIAVVSPVFIICLAHLFLHDKLTLQRLVGVSTAAFGIVLLTTKGDMSLLLSLTFNDGDVLMLLATFLFAVYSILVRRKPTVLRPLVYLEANFVLGWGMLLPWAFWEWQSFPLEPLASHVVMALVYIGVGAALLAYFAWNMAIETIGPARAAMVYYTLPIFCGVEAWLILGETVSWVHGVSGALIVCGIFIANRQ